VFAKKGFAKPFLEQSQFALLRGFISLGDFYLKVGKWDKTSACRFSYR